MILIIGGAWQGKLAFAMELTKRAGDMAAVERKIPFNSLVVNQWDMQEYPPDSSISKNEKEEEYEIAEGSQDSFEAAMKCRVIHGLHEYIRRLLKEGKSVDAFLLALRQQNPDVVITVNELGCGIVPLDPEDREWREVSGRAAVQLARTSGEVYRMVCGIAVQIK
jgi:adenosylcobinamide kinase/adenosylcobinamide-phosphate guanylyltransferase